MIIRNRKKLQEIVEQLRKNGQTIVFTNGCFDLLHKGHVIYLEEAKKFGDVLIVGINTDESIKSLKGSERPIMHLESRARVLDSLKSVDIVVPFSEVLPNNIIEIVKPNVHIKGGDYRVDDLPEAKLVKSFGGIVKIVSLVPGFSVTSIIERIKNRK